MKDVTKMLESLDPSDRPGLKERVWNRVMAPESAPIRSVRPPLGWLALAGASALLLLALQPRFPRDPAAPPSALAPDWRSREAFATELPAVSQQTTENTLDRVDRVARGHLELKARYWAARVALDKDVTLDELRRNSLGWIMKEDTRARFVGLVEETLRSGEVRLLTAQENRRLTDATNEERSILGAGPLGTPAEKWPVLEAIDREDRATLDLSALYWAWRIASSKDVSYNELHAHSDHWIMKRTTRDALFSKMRLILDENRVRALSAAEMDLLESSRARVRALLR